MVCNTVGMAQQTAAGSARAAAAGDQRPGSKQLSRCVPRVYAHGHVIEIHSFVLCLVIQALTQLCSLSQPSGGGPSSDHILSSRYDVCLCLYVFAADDTYKTVMHSINSKKTNIDRLREQMKQIERDTAENLAKIDSHNTDFQVRLT